MTIPMGVCVGKRYRCGQYDLQSRWPQCSWRVPGRPGLASRPQRGLSQYHRSLFQWWRDHGESRVCQHWRRIDVDFNPALTGNVIYSNQIGIRSDYSFGGSIKNNIIYDHALVGLWLSQAGYGGVAPQLVNNTLHESNIDAIRIDTTSTNVTLRNNSIWADGGIGMNIAADSQAGFSSDYNNLHVTNGGWIARWQNVKPTKPGDVADDGFYRCQQPQHQSELRQYVRCRWTAGLLEQSERWSRR